MMTAVSDPPHPTSVAVIDDHEAIHAAVEVWCTRARPPLTFVGGYSSVDPFLEAHPQPGGDVDVVILDLELQSRRPDFAGLKCLVGSGHYVIVHSHIGAEEVILKCLGLGAATYLVKSEGKKHLIEAIRCAPIGEHYVGPAMAGAIANNKSVGRPKLTARETEVLIAWCQTENTNLVGRALHIVPSTVKTHLKRVREKYASVQRPATTGNALTARAIQDGIVDVDDL